MSSGARGTVQVVKCCASVTIRVQPLEPTFLKSNIWTAIYAMRNFELEPEFELESVETKVLEPQSAPQKELMEQGTLVTSWGVDIKESGDTGHSCRGLGFHWQHLQ